VADADRLGIRLGALVAAAFAVTLVAGGLAWPSHAVPAPLAPVEVQVRAVAWNVTGCGTVSASGPGKVVASGTAFEVQLAFARPAGVEACLLSSAVVGTPGFALDNATIAAVVPGTTELGEVWVTAPTGFLTSSLSLTLGARTIG
jgi:hypothetical protein